MPGEALSVETAENSTVSPLISISQCFHYLRHPFPIMCLLLLVSLLLPLFFIFLFFRFFRPRRPSHFPPGPTSILETLSVVLNSKRFFAHCSDLANIYGDIVGIIIGNVKFVIISDPDVAKEAFNQDALTDRSNTTLNMEIRTFGGNYGILTADGDVWQSRRRFALKTLRDFGFGRKGSEGIILQEATMLMDYMKENCLGKKFKMSKTFFNVPVINVLWQMVMSKRFQMEDPHVKYLMESLHRCFSQNRMFMYALPGLARAFPSISGVAHRRKFFREVYTEFEREIEEHRATLDSREPRDYIDAALIEAERLGDASFAGKHLLVDVFDFFEAGSDTTSTTLKWAILYMSLHRDIQASFRMKILLKEKSLRNCNESVSPLFSTAKVPGGDPQSFGPV